MAIVVFPIPGAPVNETNRFYLNAKVTLNIWDCESVKWGTKAGKSLKIGSLKMLVKAPFAMPLKEGHVSLSECYFKS